MKLFQDHYNGTVVKLEGEDAMFFAGCFYAMLNYLPQFQQMHLFRELDSVIELWVNPTTCCCILRQELFFIVSFAQFEKRVEADIDDMRLHLQEISDQFLKEFQLTLTQLTQDLKRFEGFTETVKSILGIAN
jgi:hypothetical protein